MQRNDAISALEIYRKSGSQAAKLSQFFEICRGLDFGRGQKFINIKMPPASFVTTMEEYIKEAPTTLMLEYKETADDEGATTNENAAPEGDLLTEVNQEADVEENLDPSPGKNESKAASQVADLMGLYDLLIGASEFEENSLAMAIFPSENSKISSNDDNVASQAIGWDVALFIDPEGSNENVAAESEEASPPCLESNLGKQSGALDILTLDSLYNEAIAGEQHNAVYHTGQVASNPFEASENTFCAPPTMASPIPVQMVGMPYQDYFLMQQQHQQQQQEPSKMNKKSTNPFD